MAWRKLAFLTEAEDALAGHAADYTDVHGFDAAGNAPPQEHGHAAHDTTVPRAVEGAQNIWVQVTAPTAIAIGDIWIEIE